MIATAPAAGVEAKVVHFARHRHPRFLNPLTLSAICPRLAIKSFSNKALKIRLKNRQPDEPGRIQGKFAAHRMLCPELSTETVDSFPLADRLCSVQPSVGIVG